ncbi:MAG: hypothetical protein IJE62_07590 [Clostridia bacterium]|nr:hypothetical protein [Clostridia bacterium]
MKRKSVICLLIAVILVVFGMLYADYLKDDRIQADIDTKFASDYGNLIIGILNKSIQTEGVFIHKYDKLNVLGQTVFSRPQKYTEEMLEETWKVLSLTVDFDVK